MVARQIKKRHLKSLDKPVKLLPLLEQSRLIGLLGTTGNEIAYTHHKLRLQLIELFDGFWKNTTTNTTCPISNNSELKVFRIIQEFCMSPRFLSRLYRMIEIRIK